MKAIASGAESTIYLDNDRIVKIRHPKSYRIREIDDRLRKFRTRREAKVIQKLPVDGPRLISVDDKEMKIEMEYIKGPKLRDVLKAGHGLEIGRIVAQLHKKDIIHGDLTTSNMILKDGKIFLVDFGLSQFSDKIEDKAVDLHLLRQALESKHHDIWEDCYDNVLRSYDYSKKKQVLKRLEKVEGRGRNKGK